MKTKPKTVNPQPPAGNALKGSGERRANETEEDPLKEVEDRASGGAARKPRSGKLGQSAPGLDTPQPAPSGTAGDVSGEVSPEERQRMIEEAAYYCAQRRQAQGGEGTADDDWAEAEAQIERLLAERRDKNRS
jgi:hypothetical protein